jgi:long-chain acyl-CoA synthetase
MNKTGSLSPLEALSGRDILLLGSTGFLAKVMLSMLLERFSARRVYCLVRPTKSLSADDRFRDEVLGSEMMAPLRRRFGASFDALVAHQVEVLAGDLSSETLGLDEATLTRLRADLDLVINSAGLVSFNPQLDQALESNAVGAELVARFTRSCDHAKLVHISTCFVAGARSGRIREDADVVGYFPKQSEMPGVTFDWRREVRDLRRLVEHVKSRTDDAALEATFRREALARLEREGREAHERTVRAAMTNQRRRWITDEQIRLGKERAEHWGWPNIYTLTKALGEQALASVDGLDWAIVRPAIVESAATYPFPGWNEGMNTSAPLAYLAREGQVIYPGTNDLILDVVPVDYVASATLAAGAALLEGERHRVYQVAAGDVNPCSMARTITLVSIYRRRWIREQKSSGDMPAWKANLIERWRAVPTTRKQYERFGAPALEKWVSRARAALDDLEPDRMGSFGEIVHRARSVARDAESQLSKVTEVFDLFMPFIWENRYIFSTRNTRGLFDRMNEADRALLPFDTENIDWRQYWLDVHLPGLEKWVFPKLEFQGPTRIQIPRDYRDLAELFDTRTREHGRRTAYRIIKKDDVADHFSYREVRKAAFAVRSFLESRHIGRGDRVVLASDGCPEWGMSYFGVILAGATVVPVDTELSRREIENIVQSSGAACVIASEKVRTQLIGTPTPKGSVGALSAPMIRGGNGSGSGNGHHPVEPLHEPRSTAAPVFTFEEVFATVEPDVDPTAALEPVRRKPEDVASIIYTSGTTGRPKGVVLTDRNFAALTARLQALFELRHSDSLLSVLPPYHTFEFSAGLLMPLASGASVTYLEERTPELMQRAFRETPVTALIGVPAVWESMHRRISQRLDELPLLLRLAMRGLARANRALREWNGVNFGRVAFRTVHNAFGGRMRYLVSGGAPLPARVFDDLRGFGFSVYEGYGLTEAAPVLTVGWPRQRFSAGTVGWPLPGIEVRIKDPDQTGRGEIIARGPTIMSGYLDDPEATARALRDGWLHTGDLGYLDDAGRLFIAGRTKDVIIDASGKNVYPDELEEIYADVPWVKELSIVGLPSETGDGEQVAALVVPDYDAANEALGLDRNAVRDAIRERFREVGSKLAFARRVKQLHFTDLELPRTSTRKIKRGFVRTELLRQTSRPQTTLPAPAASTNGFETRVRRVVAQVAQRRLDEIRLDDRLVDSLGFDSILQLELLNALEQEFPNTSIRPEELATAESVADLTRLLEREREAANEERDVGHTEETPPLEVPRPLAEVGKLALIRAQHSAYDRLLDVEVEGRGNIPANRNFIVVSNHSSHLDMGLVKYALGPFGRDLKSLAAKDYFFDDPLRRAYFENFTNLLPIERHGSLRKSLRLATQALHDGFSLLVFPEGTRSRDGVMAPFKPAVGYLCLHEGVDVLPMFLDGTHDALPVGAWRPRNRRLRAIIGPPIEARAMRAHTEGSARSQAYREITLVIENAVRRLGGLEPRPDDDSAVRRSDDDARPRSSPSREPNA